MKNIKLISLSILRFFKLNLASVVGFMLLVFFSISIFTALNSVSTSLTRSYNNLKTKGNLHDFVINENYTIGNSDFLVQVVNEGGQNYSYSFTVNFNLWSGGHKKVYEAFLDWIDLTNENVSSDYDVFFKNNEKLFFYFKNELGFYESFTEIDSRSEQARVLGIPQLVHGENFEDALNQAKLHLNNFLTLNLNFLVERTIPLIYKEALLLETNNEIQVQNFNSIDISTNKQNIYYKIIETNPEFSINNIVLYDGNNVSKTENFSFFINELINQYKNQGESFFINLEPNINIDPNYQIKNFESENDKFLIWTWKYIYLFLKSSWTENYTLEPIDLEILLDRIEKTKLYQKLNPWEYTESELKTALEIYSAEEELVENFNFLFSEIKNFIYLEDNYALLPTEFNVTFSKTTLIPAAGVISNKKSFESIVSPSFFEKNYTKIENNKEVFYKKKTIDINEWNFAQTLNEENFRQWLNDLDPEFKLEIDNEIFILMGSGLTPDFSYPIVNQARPIPDKLTEQIIYLSNPGYKKIESNFRGAPVENFLVGETLEGKNYIDAINKVSRNFMSWPNEINAAYLSDDLSNTFSPTSQRIVFIPQIVSSINIIAFFLTIFIVTLTLIIIVIMIKRFIEINKTDLSILLANGFSKWELVFSLTLVILLFGSIAVVLGVIVGIALQPPALMLFSSFWTLPTATVKLSAGFLLSILGISSLFFSIISWIFSFLALKGNVIDLMKKDSNYVLNNLSKFAKKAFKHSSILTLFRVSLVFSAPLKILSLSIMSAIAMSSLSFGISTLNKFQISESKTFESKKFANAVNLYSPTNAGGLYYSTPLNKNTATLFEGLYSFNEELSLERYNELVWSKKNTNTIINPSSQLPQIQNLNSLTQKYITEEYSETEDSVLLFNNYTNRFISSDSLIDKNIFLGGNLHLPSLADATLSVSDIEYLLYKTSSKLSLEHSIIFFVPWQIAEKLMPTNTGRYFNDNYEKILELMFRSDEILLENSSNSSEPIKTFSEALEPFIKFTSNSNSVNRSTFKLTYLDSQNQIQQYYLDEENNKLIENPENVFLPKAFGIIDNSINLSLKLKNDFVNIIYGVEKSDELKSLNYSMNYKKVPIDQNDETYTSVEFIIIEKNGVKTFSNKISGKGIKENSKYISLLSDNIDISSKIKGELYSLSSEVLSSKPVEYKNYESFLIPTIVNKFAQKSLDLEIGDVLTINVLNDINRFEDAANDLPEKNYSLKIVGVNDSFKDNEFYFSQENANLLTGISKLQFQIEDFNVPMQEILNQENNKEWLYGFNGFFSPSEEVPQIFSKISIYSPYNLYFSFDKITNPDLKEALKKRSDGGIPTKKEDSNFYQAILKTNTQDRFNEYLNDPSIIIPSDELIENFIKTISDIYNGDSIFVSLISNVEPTAILKNIFSNIANLTLNLQIISVSIISVSSFIIIILITLITISDSMKLAGILKALGLQSRVNASSFLMIYFPVIFLGVLVAFPLSVLFNFIFAEIIFTSLGILISATTPWYALVFSSFSIILIFLVSFLITWRKIKKQKLYSVIK